uniref:Isopentenyl-diphosphate delta-isomerase n=1 Tax=Thermosporothrix sp. COM3 TaxID=2490863 RepID=A0A455SFA5_9CHLR|nr:type 2 isopentenyl-diphosphate Delta-isomerase [Thermosporothrix sp. COM3]
MDRFPVYRSFLFTWLQKLLVTGVNRGRKERFMSKEEVKQRKLEHVQMALEQNISAPQRASWKDVHLVHQALPEVDLDEIDTSVDFLGHRLRAPIFVSSLTGGHPDVAFINRNLARVAEEYGLALGVGSQRAAIVNPELTSSFAIAREQAPTAFLLANIGAPQLIPQKEHPPFTLEQAQQAVSMIQANALIVHLNSLQEAVQPEGDRRAAGEAAALRRLVQAVSVPIIAKETGAGICREQALLLRSCGVAALDVGGAGGSSMAALESLRAQSRGNKQALDIGLLYRDWGIPTPIAVVEAGTAHVPIIATGGIRSGRDIACALALGATLVGIGHPFLQAASRGYDAVCAFLEQTLAELKVAMQLCGAATLQQMREADVVVLGETREWLYQRGFEDDVKRMARRHWKRIHSL